VALELVVGVAGLELFDLGNLPIAQPGFLPERAMVVQSVIAAVDLGRRHVSQLAELALELGPRQRGVQGQEGLEHLGIVRHRPKNVGHHTQLLLHPLEDRLDLLGGILIRD
jgi:hypothetical protein